MPATGNRVLNKIVPHNYKKNGILYFKCPLTKIRGTVQQLSGEKDPPVRPRFKYRNSLKIATHVTDSTGDWRAQRGGEPRSQ